MCNTATKNLKYYLSSTFSDKININVPPQSSLNQQIPISCSVTFQSVPYYSLQALKPQVILQVGTNQLAVSNDNMIPDKTQERVSFSLVRIVH